MTTVDQTWEWISQPLAQLRSDHAGSPDTPWEELRESFLNRLGLHDVSQSPAVQQLLEQLDGASEEERNTMISSDQLDSVAYSLIQQHTGEDAPAASEAARGGAGGNGAAYDEQAWGTFLVENGSRWDGTDESWDQFQQWFAYYAGQQGLEAPATALLKYLASEPAADRISTLAQYGVVIARVQAGGAAGPAGGAGYDENAWQAFLAEYGSRWDGTEASWDQFREWFAYYAGQQGLTEPATGLLNYLTSQPVTDRVRTLAQYGATIAPATAGAGPQQASAPATGGEAQQAAAADIPPEQVDAVVSELLAENPEFASIPEDQRAQILAEVLDELRAQ